VYKVVPEVFKEKETLALISKRHELHPNQISDWKKQFLEGAAMVFEPTGTPVKTAQEPDTAPLHEQIGRLQMELTFFKKKLTL